MLKTNGTILDFLLNNIILNVDVLGSITLFVVIGVLYCWLIVAVYLNWFFYAVDHSKSGNKFFKPFCLLSGLITNKNSTYIVDDVVIVCLELFHDMSPFTSVNIYHDVDFSVSKQPAKSESE
jgi:hypothetical protein